jgi:hypothetical protein
VSQKLQALLVVQVWNLKRKALAFLQGIGIDSLFLLAPDCNTSFLCMPNSNGVHYNEQSG